MSHRHVTHPETNQADPGDAEAFEQLRSKRRRKLSAKHKRINAKIDQDTSIDDASNDRELHHASSERDSQ